MGKGSIVASLPVCLEAADAQRERERESRGLCRLHGHAEQQEFNRKSGNMYACPQATSIGFRVLGSMTVSI